ncbi:TolC family protein [Thiohalospira sp.]|uniref:TolC family protein n=1 Tax=Thiohalospira sp. TaxID=3080549 RepID=UPI0039803D4F
MKIKTAPATTETLRRLLLSSLAALLAFPAVAQEGAAEDPEPEPLPEPLTLEDALAEADADHPDLATARARLEGARAQERRAASGKGWRAGVEARAAEVGLPSDYYEDASAGDHYARAYLTRTLYDSGATAAAREAEGDRSEAAEERVFTARQARRLSIMRRYFDTLLADLEADRAEEHMAIVFIEVDRLRDRHELGQISDVELAEKEAEYQQALAERNTANSRKRRTRSRLANALNRPGELSSRFRPPELPELDRDVPDFDELREQVREENPELAALRREVAAARSGIEQARASNDPRLDLELSTYAWSRTLRSRYDWEAALRLDIPFYQGGEVAAAEDSARARLREARARLRRTEMELEQATLEAWQDLENLAGDREAADAQRDYREKYLSYARKLYEMEVQADLGDSMVNLTAARRDQAEKAFGIAMAWARIDALRGRLPRNDAQEEAP